MSDSSEFALPEDSTSGPSLSGEPSRYVVGIDLGTTNSAVAYIDTRERWDSGPEVRTFEVQQLVGEGDFTRRQTLPSFLYLPGPHELPEGALLLPWIKDRAFAVGEFARVQGARVPGHLVQSAKSWLCHGDVDRQAPILPWGGSDDIDKLSPVDVSARYLTHVREAWNAAHAADDPELALELQDVVLTVPASFDEVARELTLEAATLAGLERVHLLEEPQAAFYAWLSANASTWSEKLSANQVILVCDVGGGTTDFSLIVVREGRQGLRFERVAVGEHLMLGGDNMDLALARLMESRLTESGATLDSQAMAGVIHACRLAKEQLLSEDGIAGDDDGAPRALPIGVAAGGSRLVGSFLQAELSLEETRGLVVDGFFPEVDASTEPDARRSGLREWGLPYVADAAVTKHLSAFLRRHRVSVGESAVASSDLARPDLILWNGAALTPQIIRDRLVDVVGLWFSTDGEAFVPDVLDNADLHLAVARGASYYGIVRRGRGVRIHGGSPRGYYIKVDAEVAAEAVADPDPDADVVEFEDPVSCVCLVRRGTEEGETIELARNFEAHVNRPVAFTLLSSSVRTDADAELLTVERSELVELPEIRTLLRFGKKTGERLLPVRIAAHLTEVGTLELFCRSQETDHQWRLRFQVRQEPTADQGRVTIDQGVTLDEELIERLEGLVRAAFQPGGSESLTGADGAPFKVTPQNIARHLRAALELERSEWPLPALRKLAELLLEVKEHRRRSAPHEARWLNLIGFCLRPGFGYPMDDWRVKELWKISHAGILHPNDEQCRTEWWILWRRVAGGLSKGQQEQLFAQLGSPLTAPLRQAKQKRPAKKKGGGKKPAKTARLGKQERAEMWMSAASLEQIDPKHKRELGEPLLEQLVRGKGAPQDWWALSRLGARVPFHGPANQVLPRKNAEGWLRNIMRSDVGSTRESALALAHLARRTGDRERDISDGVRAEVTDFVTAAGAPGHLLEWIREGGHLDMEEESRIFGEALPAGLVLVDDGE